MRTTLTAESIRRRVEKIMSGADLSGPTQQSKDGMTFSVMDAGSRYGVAVVAEDNGVEVATMNCRREDGRSSYSITGSVDRGKVFRVNLVGGEVTIKIDGVDTIVGLGRPIENVEPRTVRKVVKALNL